VAVDIGKAAVDAVLTDGEVFVVSVLLVDYLDQ